MSIALKHSRNEAEIDGGDPPHAWLKKQRLIKLKSDSELDPESCSEQALEIPDLELKQKIDELDGKYLRKYHGQLKTKVPSVKTPFTTNRVKLRPDIIEALSSWPCELHLEDSHMKFGDIGDSCDDCGVLGYGGEWYLTFPLMCMVLGDFFNSYSSKTPGLNFKCYALSVLNTTTDDIIATPEFQLRDDIKKWVRYILEKDMVSFFESHKDDASSIWRPKIFRRCLILGMDVYLRENDGLSGHVLVLMIQKVGNDPIEIVMVDNLALDSYRDPVHKWIQVAAESEIYKFVHENDYYNSKVTLTSFNIKTRISSQRPFMRCISRALRACMYLSLVRDYRNIEERSADFNHHTEIFRQHLHRMINWISTTPCVTIEGKIPIVSYPMTNWMFELNTENCYLVLASPKPIPNEFQISKQRKLDYIYGFCGPVKYKFKSDGRNAFIRSENVPKGGSMCVVSSQFGI